MDISNLSSVYTFRSDISTFTDNSTASTEEVDDVVLSEGVATDEVSETELSTDEQFELFKEELRAEISALYSDAPSNLLSINVNISDEALEKMFTDEDFKQEMLDTMTDDANGLNGLSYGSHMNVTIGEDGYSRSEITVSAGDSTYMQNIKEGLAKAKSSGSFLYEELNTSNTTSSLDNYLNQLLSGTSSMSQDAKQKELLAMINEQQNFIEQSNQHKALSSTASSFSSNNSYVDGMINNFLA